MTAFVDPATGAISVLFGSPPAIINCTSDRDCAAVNGWCQLSGSLSWHSVQPAGHGQCSCWLLGGFTGDSCTTPTPVSNSYLFAFFLVLAVYVLTFGFGLFMMIIRISKGKAQCDQSLLVLILLICSTFCGSAALSVFCYQFTNIDTATVLSTAGVRSIKFDGYKLLATVFCEFFSGWVLMQVAIIWLEFVYKFWEKRGRMQAQTMILRAYIVLYLIVFVVGGIALSLGAPGFAQILVIPAAFIVLMVYIIGLINIRPLLQVKHDGSQISLQAAKVNLILKAIQQTTFWISLCMVTLIISLSIYIAGHNDNSDSPVSQPGTIAAIFVSLSIALDQFFLARYVWLAIVRFDLWPRDNGTNSPLGSANTNNHNNNPGSHENSRFVPGQDEGQVVSITLPEAPAEVKGLGIVNPPDYRGLGSTKKKKRAQLSTIRSGGSAAPEG